MRPSPSGCGSQGQSHNDNLPRPISVQRPRAHKPTQPAIAGASPSPGYQSKGCLSVLMATPSSTAFANPCPYETQISIFLKGAQNTRATVYSITHASIFSKTCQQVKFFFILEKRHQKHLPGRRLPWGLGSLRLPCWLIPGCTELIKL